MKMPKFLLTTPKGAQLLPLPQSLRFRPFRALRRSSSILLGIFITIMLGIISPIAFAFPKSSADLAPNLSSKEQTQSAPFEALPYHCSPMGDKIDRDHRSRVTIGVLAPYGDVAAEKEWCPWITALNHEMPDLHFVLKPLQLNNIESEVTSGAIDLLLSHQGVFMNLRSKASMRWMASLEENIHLEESHAKIGSAIWVKEESPIQTLNDLRGKRVDAVSQNALGGFLLAYHEMIQNSPTLAKEIAFQYRGYPIEALFDYLATDENDAIIVPACLYERLERQDILPEGSFRLINPKEIDDFTCQTSTNLMPSWSLAALNGIDQETAKRIQSALFQFNDPDLPSWQLPYTLAEINQLAADIKHYEERETLFETLFRLAITHKIWLLFFALFLLILLINHLWLSYAATKRRKALDNAYKTMHDYEMMLSKADRMNILGEMASGIGHELNQPLSTIRNYAEGSIMILKKSDQQHPLLTPLHKINEQVSQCHNIIKNLRSWAKPEENSIREEVNLRAFLEQIIEITRLRMHGHIDIQVDIPEYFNIVITPSILEQVLANCLMNSAQAGATVIDIRLKIYPQYIKLFLFDNGPGFTQAEIDAPFVPFRTSKKDGLGLGLVICQRLIESLDGKLRIDNRRDGARGAAVRLILSRELTPTDQKEPQ